MPRHRAGAEVPAFFQRMIHLHGPNLALRDVAAQQSNVHSQNMLALYIHARTRNNTHGKRMSKKTWRQQETNRRALFACVHTHIRTLTSARTESLAHTTSKFVFDYIRTNILSARPRATVNKKSAQEQDATGCRDTTCRLPRLDNKWNTVRRLVLATNCTTAFLSTISAARSTNCSNI